eukprot:COSAG04_NODE_64_length_29689_cov_158.096992_28_plen_128_part_00
MYNYSSYPSLLLFRGNSEPTNRCPYDEDCPPVKEGCPHPGDRKGLDCWEFYSGGREQEDITFWMSTISKGLNPYDEEAKLKPGLYKDNHGPVTAPPPPPPTHTHTTTTTATHTLCHASPCTVRRSLG